MQHTLRQIFLKVVAATKFSGFFCTFGSLLPFTSGSRRLWLEKGMYAGSTAESDGGGRAHGAVTNYLLPQSLAVRGWKSECLSKAQLHFPLSQNKIPSEFLIWAEGDSRRGIRDNLKLSLDSKKDFGIFMLFLLLSPIFAFRRAFLLCSQFDTPQTQLSGICWDS